MRICKKGHDVIVYLGNVCPLCKVLEEVRQLKYIETYDPTIIENVGHNKDFLT